VVLKTWHIVALVGLAVVVGWMCLRRTSTPGIAVGDKAASDVGAPPLPNVAPSKPGTATYFTFVQPNAFGRRPFA